MEQQLDVKFPKLKEMLKKAHDIGYAQGKKDMEEIMAREFIFRNESIKPNVKLTG